MWSRASYCASEPSRGKCGGFEEDFALPFPPSYTGQEKVPRTFVQLLQTISNLVGRSSDASSPIVPQRTARSAQNQAGGRRQEAAGGSPSRCDGGNSPPRRRVCLIADLRGSCSADAGHRVSLCTGRWIETGVP